MSRAALALVAALAAAVPAAPAPGRPAADAFRAEMLADGVAFFRPVDPGPLGLRRTNALVVRRDDGLLVVGAQPSPEAARELLGSIAATFSEPVRYLVLTHPTVAETGGASAFPPDALRIAAEGYLEALADPEFDRGAELRATAGAPEAWSAPPPEEPDLALRGTALLRDARHPVELQIAPPAYAPGGLLVELPADGVVWLGPILFPPGTVPNADLAVLDAWMAVLNRTLTRRVETALPRDGGLLERGEIAASRDALAWLRGQVEAAFVRRVPLGEIRGVVLGAEDLDRHFALDPAERPRFDVLLERAIGDAVREREKRGLDIPR